MKKQFENTYKNKRRKINAKEGIRLTTTIQNVKVRKRNPPSEFAKELKKIRERHTPLHTVEIEINVLPFQQWRLIRINEQLRVIRNTVLGQLYKNYSQMIRTKEFKKVLKTIGLFRIH